MMKKILIIYATYGNGHKAIAKYINNYFYDKNKNLEIKMIDMLDYSKKSGRMSQKISEGLMLKLPFIWTLLFKFADHKYTSRFTNRMSMKWFDKDKLSNSIKGFNPDLVISTHFYASCFVSDLKSKDLISSELITIITDYDVHDVWLDHYKGDEYIVVPSKEEKKCLAKNISKKYIKTFGIPIFPNEEDLLQKRLIIKKLGLDPQKLTCVCFAGGGGGSTATIPYIKAILKAHQDINYIFISGSNKKVYEKIKRLVGKDEIKNAIVYGFANNVPELLIASDFVVTKPGGAQSTECLYFKKPMLFIKGNGGQENINASYFTKSGYARLFKSPLRIYKYFQKLDKNLSDIKRMENNLSKADNTKAMKKLYDFALKLLK